MSSSKVVKFSAAPAAPQVKVFGRSVAEVPLALALARTTSVAKSKVRVRRRGCLSAMSVA